MKHLFRITMIAPVLLVACWAVAQPAFDPGRMEELRDRLYPAVKPTADQEVQLDQIFRTHRQAAENWRRQNAEILQAARRLQQDALQAGDRDTLQAVGKELRELMESRRTLFRTMMNQMEDVLDEQQFAKAREILRPAHIGSDVLRTLQKITLAETQKAEMQKILDQAAVRARTKKNRAAREEIMDDAVEVIRQTVLSQAQRDALEALLRQAKEQARRRAMLSKMDFTDEQKAKIKTLLAEARKRAEQAEGPQQKQAILAKAHRTIRRDVWTQKQRDQFFLGLIEQHRWRMRSIGMTEEQIDRAEKILTDAHAQAQAAGGDEEKRQILHDAFETIRRTVLREDQRERLK